MEAQVEAEEEELVEEGAIGVREADVMEVEAVVAPTGPPKTPSVHPFFQPRVESSGNQARREERRAQPMTPTQLHANAKEYLEGAPNLPDSDLVLSTRQEPRAGPYGKRSRDIEKTVTAPKAHRGSEPKRVTVKDRLSDFPAEPFLDLEGTHLFPFPFVSLIS